jgi:hypothetical protein
MDLLRTRGTEDEMVELRLGRPEGAADDCGGDWCPKMMDYIRDSESKRSKFSASPSKVFSL